MGRRVEILEKMVGRVGFEPTTNGLKVRHSTNDFFTTWSPLLADCCYKRC